MRRQFLIAGVWVATSPAWLVHDLPAQDPPVPDPRSVTALAALPKNGSAPLGGPRLESPTLRSLGVYWIIRGDENKNARVDLDYREAGAPRWVRGPSLFRVEKAAELPEGNPNTLRVPADAWLFAGSVVLLKPNTGYELQLRLSDPDGFPSVRTGGPAGPAARAVERQFYLLVPKPLRARTIAEPIMRTPVRRLHVVPGAGGGAGTLRDPYRGLAAAQAQARPGDLFLLHAGAYEGTFRIAASGQPGRPIIWRGAGDGETILDAQGNSPERPSRAIDAVDRHDVWLERLTIRDAEYGVVANNASRLVIRRCHIYGVEYGIAFTRNDRGATRGIFISDNVIEGPSTWPRTKGIENARGIQATGTGHVVCYNRIRGFADAIDTFPSRQCAAIDFHNNEIHEMTDDGIEMDYSERNTRCFFNRLTNVFQGISVQPIYGGPVYIFRNVLYNVGVEPFKMHNRPSGALMFHNTSVKKGMPLLLWTPETVRNSVYRNNLFIGTEGAAAYDCSPPMIDCDFDYDGFGGGPWRIFLKWNNVRYRTLADVVEKSPVYRHAIQVDAGRAFASGLKPPDDETNVFPWPRVDLRLRAGSNAIDRGVILPGFNDGFKGKAPDLGAYELGTSPPHYGPRPEKGSDPEAGSVTRASGAAPLAAASRPVDRPVGVVSHVKVISSAIEDVSSMEAWKRSFIKDGMTDAQKAMAVWQTVVKFRHQDPPPDEYLQSEGNVHDPIKTFNVYGYGMCCCAASNIEALARYAGLPARGRILHGHSVPEVFYDGAWHLLDASLINFVPKRDGTLASVDEIIASVRGWLAEHPELRGNDAGLRAFMRDGGWKQGPELLANSPFYDRNGWLPAATHGWYSTMQEYDLSNSGVYEYGYSQGYQVNLQLREGERLTRGWSNRGLHVNQGEGSDLGCLRGVPGEGDLRYAPRYGDLAPGRIGNGTLEYDVPLADGGFRHGALTAENLACAAEDGHRPALHVRQPARPGILVIRMPSSYVYLRGQLFLTATVGRGGRIDLLFSDNHGLDWKPLATLTRSASRRVDLTPLVRRRYDYRLKVVLDGKGTGLDAVRLTHDIQHSQRVLPALTQGSNTITVRSGPQDGTITLEGSLDPAARGKQLLYTAFHPKLSGLRGPWLRPAGAQGSITFPVRTPGEMVRLRVGGHYRARDRADGWELQVSFDGGRSFRTVDRCAGPTPGHSQYVTVTDVPAGTRAAVVRWSGRQRDTTCLFGFRIDADYREPWGGFAPLKVTYVWSERGVEKRHVHVARTPEERYRIDCVDRPVMRDLIVERVRADEPGPTYRRGVQRP